MIEVAIIYKRMLGHPDRFATTLATVHAIRNGKTACGREIGTEINGWFIEEVVTEFNAVSCKTCHRTLDSEDKKRLLESLKLQENSDYDNQID